MKKLLVILFCAKLAVAGAQPFHDIVERKILQERKVLAYKPIREADIFWEKRVWRVIDVREKMNQVFTFPGDPFFGILQNAAINGDIRLFSAENDRFEFLLDSIETRRMFYTIDTFEIINPLTQEMRLEVIENSINWEDIKRFRIKETWFFDSKTGAMNVRISGIAPLIEVYDENGYFRFEKPMFWVWYPETRPLLAQHKVFNEQNDASLISWEDLFEMRFFSSHIYKASNVLDFQLQHYLTGLDLLMESDKISQEIFNFEHDLWSF